MPNFLKLPKLYLIPVSLLFFAIIIIIIGLFTPFTNIKYFVLDKPNTNIEIVVTKFDLFNPKLTILKPNADGTIIASVSDYKREGLFFFKDIGTNNGEIKKTDFSGIDARFNYSDMNKAKEIAIKNDLSKVNPDPKQIDGSGVPQISKEDKDYQAKKEEAYRSANFAYDAIELEPILGSRNISVFFGISTKLKLDKLNDLFNKNGDIGGILGTSPLQTFTKENNYREYQAKITDNPKVKFVAFKIKCAEGSRCDGSKNDTLEGVNIVLKDRTIISVPTKPDGTFNFDSTKSKWE